MSAKSDSVVVSIEHGLVARVFLRDLAEQSACTGVILRQHIAGRCEEHCRYDQHSQVSADTQEWQGSHATVQAVSPKDGHQCVSAELVVAEMVLNQVVEFA